MLVAMFGYSDIVCIGSIQDLELYYVQLSCCRNFSAANILPNPKFEKKKKFIGGFSKQYGFASQGFLVVRGNGWGFLWSGRHARRW